MSAETHKATEPSVLYDRLFEAMYYAGREYLRGLDEAEIRAFMAYNRGNHAWMQEVAEDELEHRREEVAS